MGVRGNAERAKLGEIGHRLGRRVLGELANVALPDTILDGTASSSPANSMARMRRSPGRNPGSTEILSS